MVLSLIKDIAFEFATWISPEFKFYLIKEFQRLKEDDNKRLEIGWDIRRTLTKINYKIHTDAIRDNLIPKNISKHQSKVIYANVLQLVVLSNLESLNAEFIRQGISQSERLVKLNKIAIIQMKTLVSNNSIKNLE